MDVRSDGAAPSGDQALETRTFTDLLVARTYDRASATAHTEGAKPTRPPPQTLGIYLREDDDVSETQNKAPGPTSQSVRGFANPYSLLGPTLPELPTCGPRAEGEQHFV